MTDRPSPVRVASWNLWWRFGPWQRRRAAIAAVLTHARPDVCGLQEAWASPSDHLAAWLADQLGLHWAWTPSPAPERWQQRIGDPAIQLGNARSAAGSSTIHSPRSDRSRLAALRLARCGRDRPLQRRHEPEDA